MDWMPNIFVLDNERLSNLIKEITFVNRYL